MLSRVAGSCSSSGVGISFSGLAGIEQGLLVTVAIALHNIPEGLAVARTMACFSCAWLLHWNTDRFIVVILSDRTVPAAGAVVLVARGESAAFATGWAVLSSLGQPLVAIPAFIFVDHFAAIQPVAFGFAAGSMIFVCCLELLPEAFQKSNPDAAAVRRPPGNRRPSRSINIH